MPDSDLPEFIQALCDPALHGNPPEGVRLVETHISWVVLTGKYAYKIKKPVNFGFLDYSTLALRQFFCMEEYRLNQRLASSIYLGVVTITLDNGHFEIEGTGTVVEYAVKLKQFDDSCLADRLLEENQISAGHIDGLAQTLAEFHSHSTFATLDDNFGNPETILCAAEHNFDHLLRLIGQLGSAGNEVTDGKAGIPVGNHDERFTLASNLERIKALMAWTRSEFQKLSGVFLARKKAGSVRECHGDLHSGNLVLINGQLIPFDCIEFSEGLRWVDCMSEIAFIFMDIDERGATDLAWRFLNRYLEISGDFSGLEVLRFYCVYRALVRAKVAALKLEKSLEPAQRIALQGQCQRYLDYAGMVKTHPPILLITHGFSGSGKSFRAKLLAERLPAIRISSDIERKRISRIGRSNQGREETTTDLYSESMTRFTYDLLLSHAGLLLKSGFNVILDATFLASANRCQCRELASRLGVSFFILDFPTPEAILCKRIADRKIQGGDPSDADKSVLELQFVKADPLDLQEIANVLTVNTADNAGIDELMQEINYRKKSLVVLFRLANQQAAINFKCFGSVIKDGNKF